MEKNDFLIILFVLFLVFVILFTFFKIKENPYGKTFLGSDSNDTKIENQEKEEKMTIKLFYYNQKSNKDNQCSEEYIIPVTREIQRTNTPLRDIVNELLKGYVTEEEKQQGFVTEFPKEGFKLLSLNLSSDGILKLEFSEVPGFTSGGSCRVSILANQIKKTVMQFEEVREVVFTPESLFQP